MSNNRNNRNSWWEGWFMIELIGNLLELFLEVVMGIFEGLG